MPTRTQSNIIISENDHVWFFDALLKENFETKKIKDVAVFNFRRNGIRVNDTEVPEDILNRAFGFFKEA